MLKNTIWLQVMGWTLIGVAGYAEAWPQYRGPNQDGVSRESVATKWSSEGPQEVWRSATSNGFSSFAVGEGRALTLVTRPLEGVDREACVALEAETGRELWATPIGVAKYDGGGDRGAEDNRGGDGARSTPTLVDGKVYVLSARLYLACLDGETGQEVWGQDLLKDFDGVNIHWQSAASPVVDEGLVFVPGGGPGQALLAFNKDSGQVVWKTQDDKMTHATPVVVTLNGVRQVIFLTQEGLVSLRTTDGEVLWRHAFPYRTSTAASPVVAGPLVYCSAGYGVGAMVVKVSGSGNKFSATELWRERGDRKLANHWSTPVYYRGYLYGMFGFKKYGTCPLKCVALATGEVVWEEEGFGQGNVILAGETLLALSDAGELVAVEATPKAYRELSRSQVVKGKCWSTPALSDGRLYVRSTQEGASLDLSLASTRTE